MNKVYASNIIKDYVDATAEGLYYELGICCTNIDMHSDITTNHYMAVKRNIFQINWYLKSMSLSINSNTKILQNGDNDKTDMVYQRPTGTPSN